jgi:hypothetical protein
MREPAGGLISTAERTVARYHFRRRPAPLAGTYRVTVWMADEAPGAGAGDSTTFYVRTEARPDSPVGSYGNAVGMYVLACAAATEAELAAARPWAGCGGPLFGATRRYTQGYLAFGDSAWTDGSGRTVRGGSVDLVHGDSTFQARFRERGWDRNRDFPDGHPREYLRGLFTEAADGGVSFTRTVEVAGVPQLRITAERISAAVIGQPQRQP